MLGTFVFLLTNEYLQIDYISKFWVVYECLQQCYIVAIEAIETFTVCIRLMQHYCSAAGGLPVVFSSQYSSNT